MVVARKDKEIWGIHFLLLGFLLNVFVICLSFPHGLFAEEQNFIKGFSYEVRALISQTEQQVSTSPGNPENILQIPGRSFSLDIRPDFYFENSRLRLLCKPRSSSQWKRINEGIYKGDSDSEDELFINEWLAGLQMTDGVFGSYGRENIQWSPSYLLSPSNPFFRENGLRNPKSEVRGQDFARLVWVPTPSWSFSAIANTDEGAGKVIEDFHPAYGVKLDYTGYQKFFSLIPSYREKDRVRMGGFAGWRLNDGLLLYLEGVASQGTDALYPLVTAIRTPQGNPIIMLDDYKEDSTDLETEALFGASYTFQAGSTITMEYFYNSPGYNDRQAELFIDFINPTNQNVRALSSQSSKISQGPKDTDLVSDLKLSRLRKNYLYFQYQHSQINNVLSIIFRYTYNLDDNSSQLIPIVQYDLNDRIQLFLVGTQNFGSQEDEFRFFLDYSYFFGIQYTF